MEKRKIFISRFDFRKINTLLLSPVFLLQSCAIYDKKPVNVDEVKDGEKVKVVTQDNRVSIYQKIYYKDDGFLYGLTSKRIKDTMDIIIPADQIDVIEAGTDPTISKDLIITKDGRTYGFDTYCFENDTIYGKMKIKRQKEEILYTEEIKGIYPYNPVKSTTGTFFLAVGSVATGLLVYTVLYLATDCWGQGCWNGW